MSEATHEKGASVSDHVAEKSIYERYRGRGGIINESDCMSALRRAEGTTTLGGALIKQAEEIAAYSGIMVHSADGAPDPRVALYAVLRADAKPDDVEYHHSQMSDQRLFAEALGMLGDVDALRKLTEAYHRAKTHCPICLKTVASGDACVFSKEKS